MLCAHVPSSPPKGRGGELRDAERPGVRPREGVEVRLLVELRGQQRTRRAALRRARDRRREARRHERRQRARRLAVAAGAAAAAAVAQRGRARVEDVAEVPGGAFAPFCPGRRARRFLPSASACADVLRGAKRVAVLGFLGAVLNLARPNCFLTPPLAPACEPTGLGLLLLTHRWSPFFGRDAILRALTPQRWNPKMPRVALVHDHAIRRTSNAPAPSPDGSPAPCSRPRMSAT